MRRYCSIRSSGGSHSSTRSSGRTTTGLAARAAGRRNTTTCSGTRTTPDEYTFHYDEIDRIPYLAPTLVGAEKAARGKTPTDVWWHTIVSPTGKERTGYATQKPLGVLERIVRVHSNPGDLLLDFFAGSGSFGEAAARNRRDFVLVDNSPDAIRVMADRLARFGPQLVNCDGVVERVLVQSRLL